MGKKLYKCDIKDCEKLFSSKFSLKRHNMKHFNNKKYVCKHCKKAFVLPQYLEEHEYTHTGEKPFICGINGCPETFR
jgi:KRAB domain-containing zinc finger protein